MTTPCSHLRCSVVAGVGLALVGLGLVGCSEHQVPAPPGVLLGVGESLLDHLEGARVEVWRGSSVPRRVRLQAGPDTLVRSRPVRFEVWDGEALGEGERGHLLGLPGADEALVAEVRRWSARPPLLARIPPARDDSGRMLPLRVVRNGLPVPGWDWRGDEPFPGEAVQWNPASERLQALGPAPPHGIVVEYRGDTREALGRHAPGGRKLPARLDPATLVRRHGVDGVTRRALALTAPAHLTLDVPGTRAEGLHLALCAAPGTLALAEDGTLVEAEPQGDGVTVVLELEQHGERRRLLEHQLEAGRPWEDLEVPLGGTAGAPFRLHLLTDPGPTGDRSWDLALLAELRLTGKVGSPPERPHVVVIDVDTLRADRLGACGARRPTTPRIDAWAAARARVFTDATSTANWTLPATATMLTGLAVHQHGVDDGSRRLEGSHRSLAARLGEAGYETRAVTEGGWVDPAFGFDLGFDTFAVVTPGTTDWEASLAEVAARRSERPLFLFHQTYAVHAPYPADIRFEDPAAPYTGKLAGAPIDGHAVLHAYRLGQLELDAADRRHIEACYDAGVAAMDEQVGAFLEGLEQALPGPRLVILTSDHGEAFFEHGIVGHSRSLYDEVLRVPLVLRLPEGPPALVREPASLMDLVPTVLDVVGLPDDPTLPGRSLTRPLKGEPLRVAQEHESTRALHLGPWKYVHAGPDDPEGPQARLHRMTRDPGEEQDLSEELPQKARQLHLRLEQWVQRWDGRGGRDRRPPDAPGPGLDPAHRAQLEALGYVGDDS